MANNEQWVEIGKRKLALSNLEKELYPGDGIVKAEVIEYYLNIAPTMLYHIKGRPLTLIRYPDGIENQRFFQKNAPDWMPEWIESVLLGGEEKKNYLMANEQAALVWLANLAALELHQIHSRKPHYDQPDYMVFDLDPPEGTDFAEIAGIAYSLREHIEQYGYHTFVKTTGGKGLHLVVPLEPEEDMAAVLDAATDLARPFVNEHDRTTLNIKKSARRGRILIDIYRNRTLQTIIAPYSLRGKPGAPVSMPLRWEELPEIESSAHFHLKNSVPKVKTDGDAWEGIGGYATPLHTRRPTDTENRELPASPRYKTAEQLEKYSGKRDFNKTSEPSGSLTEGEGNRFVIHRHHATRLHYDLRLEKEGVLKSWAIPRGFPPRPGIKRLAVQTENHPLEYLTFEGSIPKGEYGGGEMWVYASGRYVITKEKKEGVYFRLESTGLSGEYRMHKMKENEWLLEKVEQPQTDWLNEPVEPMHGISVSAPPVDGYLYEVKWDGIRALVCLEDGQIRIRSRNKNDITEQFPELRDAAKRFRAANGLFDSEIVCLDAKGKPSFQKVINRLKRTDKTAIQRLVKSNPVHCYLFDCLYLDGRPLVNEPLVRRREFLSDVVKKGTPYRLSETMEDGEALFEAAKQHGLEGIMAKKKESRYIVGKRSDLWQKVKVSSSAACIIIGYTKGKGDRAEQFGALHLAEQQEGTLIYRGKVGTGFNEENIEDVYNELQKLDTVEKPIEQEIANEKDTVWVRPELVAEIIYGRISVNGLFKEAVFKGLRPDLSGER